MLIRAIYYRLIPESNLFSHIALAKLFPLGLLNLLPPDCHKELAKVPAESPNAREKPLIIDA